MAKTAKKAPKGRIAAASLNASSTAGIGNKLDPRDIEKAMGDAHLKALAEGVTDPAKIRKLMLAARDEVVAASKEG